MCVEIRDPEDNSKLFDSITISPSIYYQKSDRRIG